MAVTLKANTAALNAALTRFLRDKGPELADAGARKAALDVVGETVRAITHGLDGTPRRVDTGRYRAAWRAGARAAGLSVGSLRGSTSGSATAEGSQPGDGYGRVEGRGLAVRVTVGNAVEYGPAVEYGSRGMAPGNHLTRALTVVRRAVPADTSRGSIRDLITRAWSRKG